MASILDLSQILESKNAPNLSNPEPPVRGVGMVNK